MKKRIGIIMYRGRLLLVALLICMMGRVAYCEKRSLFSAKQQRKITPDQALKDLIAGNKRFCAHSSKICSSLLKLSKKASKRGQFPKAVILACMDSRSIPEFIFDQSIADIFTLRVAGNVVNDDIFESMEFATKYAGAKLIVVMGHTQCGAIKAACECVTSGNLKSLVEAIRPAVAHVKKQNSDEQIDCNDDATLKAVALQNVRNMKAHIIEKSPVIREMLEKGEIRLVGALHDLRSGVVTFE